eukprot:15443518-Alexandrium_andersonii.AAC.1
MEWVARSLLLSRTRVRAPPPPLRLDVFSAPRSGPARRTRVLQAGLPFVKAVGGRARSAGEPPPHRVLGGLLVS